jgi:AraC-like DNA-binding protein
VAYREHAPPPALRGAVECGWIAALHRGETPHAQGVLPDGCMDLIWNGTELLVAGPDTAAHLVERGPGEPVVGLRFAPGVLPGLLGVPAAAVRDQRVPLREMHGRLARAAAARIAGGAAPTAALAEVASALPGRPDLAVGELAARIGAGSAAATTAAALGWTTRTLHRRCLDAFGYGPAVLRRILRFRRAAALLHAGVTPSEVAAVAGYADQPHLSREVRALSGVSPGQLLRPAEPQAPLANGRPVRLPVQLAREANRSTPLPSGSSTTA